MQLDQVCIVQQYFTEKLFEVIRINFLFEGFKVFSWSKVEGRVTTVEPGLHRFDSQDDPARFIGIKDPEILLVQ